MVAIGGARTAPSVLASVLARQQLQLINPAVSGAAQPYHAAQRMELEQARLFVDDCAGVSAELALTAVRNAIAGLAARGYRTTTSSILLGSGRPTGELSAILASHPAIHTAEGQFFRGAIAKACRSCGLVAADIKERDLLAEASQKLRLTPEEIELRVSDWGKSIGPPWQKDQKMAAVAGWLRWVER